MLEQECQLVAQELINATATLLNVTEPEKAYPVVVAGLVLLGWNKDEAAELAEVLITKY